MRQALAGTLAGLVAVNSAWAGASIEIDEESKLDIGFRVQPVVVITETDLDGDGSFESETDFRLRRGRLRLKGVITDDVTAFLQTDIGSGPGDSGLDWRVIDAWVSYKLCPAATVFAGENMAPASRQNLTSSGALMAIDRPGINYKTLTWGTRSVYAFANRTFGDSDAGFRGEVDVRDLGVTIFAAHSVNKNCHYKFYVGGYDGIQESDEDTLRYTGRFQLNLFDAEPDYFNNSAYLGKKKTVGIGASVDAQKDVAVDSDKGNIDYAFNTVDVFADLPCGAGTFTFEAALEELDLDDAASIDRDGDPETPGVNCLQSQGDGYYVQAGYLVNNCQPWVGYESWDSDADGDVGSYDLYRVGLSYFFKGHNANVKIGLEELRSDANIGTTTEDKIRSVVAGLYVTY